MLYAKRRASVSELESEWTALSKDASLFTSWAWNSSWWRTWGDSCELELYLYSFHTGEGRLFAIAPLFFSYSKTRGGIALRQLHVFRNF